MNFFDVLLLIAVIALAYRTDALETKIGSLERSRKAQSAIPS